MASSLTTATKRPPRTPRRKSAPTERSGNAESEFVDAKTASGLLGVKPQTLYAYVSRGLVRAAPRPGVKGSLYYREDLDIVRLKGRRGAQPNSGSGDRFFLRSGGVTSAPTAITTIGDKGPLYRGWLAVDLAIQHRRFESCVELLWNGVLPAHAVLWKPLAPPVSLKPFIAALARVAAQNTSRQLMAVIAQAYSACIGRDAEAALGAPSLAARQLLQVMAPVFGLLAEAPHYQHGSHEEPLAALVARSCGLDERSEEVQHAIDACLVLAADHDLVPSTFAARIAASAGGDIFACVNSALGAFEGGLNGMGCDEAEMSLKSTRSPKAYVEAARRRRERKETIAGYGHPLYPAGDPRAALLLDLARQIGGRQAQVRQLIDCVSAMSADIGVAPNLSVGLVAVARALRMPLQAPGALMALGRSAGWVAHSFEQRLSGFLVRPRVHYIGPPAV